VLPRRAAANKKLRQWSAAFLRVLDGHRRHQMAMEGRAEYVRQALLEIGRGLDHAIKVLRAVSNRAV
jgi:hypothetical protein